MNALQEFIEWEFLRFGSYSLTIAKALSVGFIILLTYLVLWIIRKALFRKRTPSKFEDGNLHAFFQIIQYVVWIFAIVLMLQTINVNLNALLAGSAALLVGIGLGLQTTFNNFVSGIILLFERSIKVGDILEVDGDIIKIQQINLRTSSAINRDDIFVIIPNSLITSNKVINWSHQSKKTRFKIEVGVAYGSDVDLVIDVLQESALVHPEITNKASVLARFTDFGNSSLDFEILFFSNNIFRIEHVKSDIRRTINRKFIKNGITIPFPQMDLHLKSDLTKEK